MSLIRIAEIKLTGEGDTLTVGKGLRVGFDTYASVEPASKPATVRVFNLSKSTISRIVEGMDAELTAGYDDDAGPTASGKITTSRTYRGGMERITEIQIIPAAQLVAATAKFEKEYPEGPVGLRQIVMDSVSAMGGTISSIEAIPDIALEDFNSAGSAKETLRKVLKSHGITFAENLGLIVFYPDGQAVPSAMNHTINKFKGLIGSPSSSEQGASAVVHFDRQISPGDVINLQSEDVTGMYKVVKLEHKGDTFGSEAWSSKLELKTVA